MATSPETVMVVEDDPDCLEALELALVHGGYHVATATNGLDALRYLETYPSPALILLDLMMPVMSGWQFLEERARRPELARIPVVLLSGERDLKRHASGLGVAGSIMKPVKLAELLSTVRRVVGSPAQAP